MAVRNLSSVTSVFGKRIPIPRRVNGDVVQYRVDGDCVSFFSCDNGESRKVVVGRHNIIGDAKYVEFDEMNLGTHSVVGAPKYYSGRGKFLKMGNR